MILPPSLAAISFQTRENQMANAIKDIAKYIERNGGTDEAATLRDLCSALEQQGAQFELHRLFDMKPKAFELMLRLMDEWRFDRHVASRRLQKYLDQKDE
jgi:hypothetical protein